ncbi:unnamed protein product [Mytilus coruscus]|uniref:Uncharacterized protein n=1 Tax=Mytilus coruscus TaxID=42192 RepID=A0A6J8B241_MYTCO|nr:unnamed protein product [Mytilus coruscus]
MKVGEKVIVLLPTAKNKLLMQWKGPYTIVEKFGNVDNRIQMNRKIKTFHANLLKRYVERCDVGDIVSMVKDDVLAVVSSAVIDTDSDQVEVYDEIHEIPFTDSEVFPDTPGCTDILEHDIKLSSETPIRMKPYPIPHSMLDTVNIEIFVLMTDASDRGIGAVLMQNQENIKMPIAYASRKLKKSEVIYSTIEKECFVIVWVIQKFQRYLYGREFILETDNQPLTYLNKKKVANARLMRWALTLHSYRFRIVVVKGKDNTGADYHSRV